MFYAWIEFHSPIPAVGQSQIALNCRANPSLRLPSLMARVTAAEVVVVGSC